MREILFRAKEIGTDKWVEGYLVKISEDDYRIATEEDINWAYTKLGDYDGVMTCVDPETICQYTGLTDKNGNKIWENDILKYSYDYENSPWLISGEDIKYYIGAVFWQEWRGTWAVCSKGKKKGCNQDVFKYSRNPNRTEVIGNIFDNPELLENE